MPDYFYDMDLVVDPLNPSNVVANGSVAIYDPADTAGTTLLALKDPSGLPLPNPLTSNANGFLPPRIAQVPQTLWKSGGFTGYFNSYKGLRDEAVQAVASAQTAANTAATAAADRVTTAAVQSGKLILTKADGTLIDTGSVIGPKGDKGDKGADGAAGVNGSNVLPTQEAIAQAVTTDGPAKTALSDTYATKSELAAIPTGGGSSKPLAYTGPMADLRAALTKKATQPVVIVFLGSSTTHGGNTAVANRWVTLLAAESTTHPVKTLAEAVASPPTTPGLHLINAGISGANTGSYVTTTTATQIGALNPSLVVHMIGSNDFKDGTAPLTAKGSIKYHLNNLDAAITVPHAHLFIHSYERYDMATYAHPWSAYRDMLKDVVAEDPTKRVFLDVSEPFYNVGIPSSDPFGLMMADKIHLNDPGHRLMADVLSPHLYLPKVAIAATTSTYAPAPFAADHFQRADGALGLTSTGNYPWTMLGGTIQVVGNLAKATALGPVGTRAVIDTGMTKVAVSVKSGSLNAGVAARYSPDGTGYVFMYSGSATTYRISRQDAAGSFAQVVVATGVTPVAGDVLTLECNGNNLVGKVNGVVVCSATETATNYTGTLCGIVTLNTDATMDNFKVHELA